MLPFTRLQGVLHWCIFVGMGHGPALSWFGHNDPGLPHFFYRTTAKVKVKVKVHTLDIAPLPSESPPQKRSGMARVLEGFQFYLHTHTFIRNRNEPYLPLPSQPQLVLIYRPRRDGRLSRPWCEVPQAEIRTRNPTSRLQIRHSTTQPLAHLAHYTLSAFIACK